jgi:hypothetical protein
LKVSLSNTTFKEICYSYKGFFMGMKEAYEQKLQAQLDEIALEIEKLNVKANKAEADTKLEYHKEIDKLKALQEQAKVKLDNIKQSSNDAWEDLKSGMDNAWTALSDAVKSANSRFANQ